MAKHKELRTIWGAARQLELDERALRDLVERISGQRSISALSRPQVLELIDTLVRMGARVRAAEARKPSGRRHGPDEVLLITGPQRELIEDLRRQLGGSWLRDPYFEGACQRLFGRARPRTAGEAARVIEMCKARLAHDRGKRQSTGSGGDQ